MITAIKINEANKNPNLLIDNSLILGPGDVRPQYQPSQSYVKPAGYPQPVAADYVKPVEYVRPVQYAPAPPGDSFTTYYGCS